MSGVAPTRPISDPKGVTPLLGSSYMFPPPEPILHPEANASVGSKPPSMGGRRIMRHQPLQWVQIKTLCFQNQVSSVRWLIEDFEHSYFE
jgi:hypothetical protein